MACDLLLPFFHLFHRFVESNFDDVAVYIYLNCGFAVAATAVVVYDWGEQVILIGREMLTSLLT
jgi:hypothetical protein